MLGYKYIEITGGTLSPSESLIVLVLNGKGVVDPNNPETLCNPLQERQYSLPHSPQNTGKDTLILMNLSFYARVMSPFFAQAAKTQSTGPKKVSLHAEIKGTMTAPTSKRLHRAALGKTALAIKSGENFEQTMWVPRHPRYLGKSAL